MKNDSAASSREDMDNLSNLPENGVTTKNRSPDSVANELSPSVSDQVATGTINILESPYISDGPGRIANAPVPSVYVSMRFQKVKSLLLIHPSQQELLCFYYTRILIYVSER